MRSDFLRSSAPYCHSVKPYFNTKQVTQLVPLQPNTYTKDTLLESTIEVINNRAQLTALLKQIFAANIHAIYPIQTNQYFVVQSYASGSGNHYYDNISITYVIIEEEAITYKPLSLPIQHTYGNNNIWHQVNSYGSLVFSQHQQISVASPIVVTYDYRTKTLHYAYSFYESISDSDNTQLVKGAYQFNNGQFVIK